MPCTYITPADATLTDLAIDRPSRCVYRLAPSATAAQVAGNIRAWRAFATPAQEEEGADWYPANGCAIAAIASDAFDSTGDYVSPDLACAVFATYSQNSTWKANVSMATRYLNGSGPFGLANVQRELAEIEDAADPLTVDLGLKRTAFMLNLAGVAAYPDGHPMEGKPPVTCDRWHIEAGYGQRLTLTADLLAVLTEATMIVAAEYGEDPHTTQAIVWCAIRPSGDGK